MPFKRAKCKSCGIEYNIFLFSGGFGYSFDKYPCRKCRSIDKEEIPHLKKSVEGYKQAVELYDKKLNN